jgi:sigma-B regulation protein RsbU (phosphoserine phosphatase)
MKILIAEDEPVSRRLLQASLAKWGYEVTVASDGAEAWNLLQQPEAPSLVILDWLMPQMDGLDICRRFRQLPGRESAYILLLTSRDNKDDIITGLESGADDYITKPFDPGELKARLQVGVRLIALQEKLAQHVRELTEALSRVKQLHGLLPICAYCKKIRDDQNYWHKVESYIAHHADVRFSHSVCPECYTKLKLELDQE